ncbi:hypothetical protein HYS91_00570 [Candidatus Daviesbacteria bacterium]|nr:hypothetical protein [Candidatus Daviesbacteria bacterium]
MGNSREHSSAAQNENYNRSRRKFLTAGWVVLGGVALDCASIIDFARMLGESRKQELHIGSQIDEAIPPSKPVEVEKSEQTLGELDNQAASEYVNQNPGKAREIISSEEFKKAYDLKIQEKARWQLYQSFRSRIENSEWTFWRSVLDFVGVISGTLIAIGGVSIATSETLEKNNLIKKN